MSCCQNRLAATLILALMVPLAAAGAANTSANPKLVVLDIELTGDLGGPELALEHERRLESVPPSTV
jgi:hypothetical protein